jgi:hypothetical protein
VPPVPPTNLYHAGNPALRGLPFGPGGSGGSWGNGGDSCGDGGGDSSGCARCVPGSLGQLPVPSGGIQACYAASTAIYYLNNEYVCAEPVDEPE